MKVDRAELLQTLTVAGVGLTKREILDQSNAFVFTKDELITFNGEVLTRIANPLEGVEGAVPADDLLKLLAKFPDDEVELVPHKEELRLKGNRRQAGIARMAEIHLPFDDVPKPKGWLDVSESLMGNLLQAARVCGRDETQPMTTVVHLTADKIEACDNFRLFRLTAETGVDKDVLIPASSINSVGIVSPTKVAVTGGWIHLRTKGKHILSIRCVTGDYPDLTKLLKLKNPKRVQLPGNLPDILSRAEVMYETTYDAMVSVAITSGEMTLTARKETGWYKEAKKIKYKGEPINFEVNPKFLNEILDQTRKVTIGGDRLRIETGDSVFVVSLEVKSE